MQNKSPCSNLIFITGFKVQQLEILKDCTLLVTREKISAEIRTKKSNRLRYIVENLRPEMQLLVDFGSPPPVCYQCTHFQSFSIASNSVTKKIHSCSRSIKVSERQCGVLKRLSPRSTPGNKPERGRRHVHMINGAP